jgi:hypothetical protein
VDKKQIDALESLLKRPDLTAEQREALQQVIHPPSSAGAADIELDLSAFERIGPDADKIRLCLDFGTAMSKAWATGRGTAETLPLPIGQASGGEGLTVPSSIYIDNSGHIYLGHDAERQHRAEVWSGRPRFDNLKRMLSEATVGVQLSSLPLRDGIDPTGSGLTGGDLLILYFAWLTDLSENALEIALEATEGKFSVGKSDVRGAARRFAIPCFESTDGKQGQARAAWARQVMTDALLRAQVLADTLRGKWDKLTTNQLKGLMVKLYQLDANRLSRLMVGDCAVREPIAAGASRFDSMLGERDEPATAPIREYLLVVDAGAGTTDFALFQAITRVGEMKPSYALLRKSVRMSLIAGNEIDLILRPIVLEACGVDQQRLGAEDFAYAKMDLDGQIREIKRNLFDQTSVAVELHPAFSGRVNLKRLLSDPKMRQDGAELIRMRNDILASVFEHEQMDVLSAAGGVLVYVLLTGGSCGLPIMRDLAAGEFVLRGMRFRFELVDELPDWILSLPREAAQQLADVYPQCAVAIGGSVPTLPEELRDMELPVTPARPGRRTLPKTQITGM